MNVTLPPARRTIKPLSSAREVLPARVPLLTGYLADCLQSWLPSEPNEAGRAKTKLRRTGRPGLTELGERPAQVADGLRYALLVLHQGKAHVALPARAKADPGRGGDPGFVDQVLRELERTHLLVRLG